MMFVIGLVVGIVLGGVGGVALCASGLLHPGNCKVCGFFAKDCKIDAHAAPGPDPTEPPPASGDVG